MGVVCGKHGRDENSVFDLEKVDRWNPIRTYTIRPRSRPMRFLGFSNHEKGAPRQEISKWSTVCSTFSRGGWSVVRSASLAKGGTSKKRPSPHIHKEVPTRSNKVSPRTFQTVLVYFTTDGKITILQLLMFTVGVDDVPSILISCRSVTFRTVHKYKHDTGWFVRVFNDVISGLHGVPEGANSTLASTNWGNPRRVMKPGRGRARDLWTSLLGRMQSEDTELQISEVKFIFPCNTHTHTRVVENKQNYTLESASQLGKREESSLIGNSKCK
jgi:hypothetical protein